MVRTRPSRVLASSSASNRPGKRNTIDPSPVDTSQSSSSRLPSPIVTRTDPSPLRSRRLVNVLVAATLPSAVSTSSRPSTLSARTDPPLVRTRTSSATRRTRTDPSSVRGVMAPVRSSAVSAPPRVYASSAASRGTTTRSAARGDTRMPIVTPLAREGPETRTAMRSPSWMASTRILSSSAGSPARFSISTSTSDRSQDRISTGPANVASATCGCPATAKRLVPGTIRPAVSRVTTQAAEAAAASTGIKVRGRAGMASGTL